MRRTITKSDKNLKILNKLITSGFYNGYVGVDKFELTPNRFTNNHRLIGVLNDSENYDLKFDLKFPMNVAAKLLLGFGILTSIIMLIIGNWLFPIFFFIIPFLIFYIAFKVNEKKEIGLFTDKLLEFHKTEFD
ncbi:hypothetical protein Q4Q34_06350 [Flavivirga abyssicola]|uniref:hypothetical protein n=1 Tax=Flavivirga abyssicola TaxID=3063533 RepID=UPI0026E0865B|nr:hypothetical protein [Flavivirga sp. MEBiC07777]WVK14648.1 hypothetical protein Q4Q34_06350 [Flavivirga sp. MEBiC07777]